MVVLVLWFMITPNYLKEHGKIRVRLCNSPKWKDKIGYVPTSGAFLEQVVAITKLKVKDAAP